MNRYSTGRGTSIAYLNWDYNLSEMLGGSTPLAGHFLFNHKPIKDMQDAPKFVVYPISQLQIYPKTGMIKVKGVVFSPEDFLNLSHLIATVCADKNCINNIEAINAWFYNHQNIGK